MPAVTDRTFTFLLCNRHVEPGTSSVSDLHLMAIRCHGCITQPELWPSAVTLDDAKVPSSGHITTPALKAGNMPHNPTSTSAHLRKSGPSSSQQKGPGKRAVPSRFYPGHHHSSSLSLSPSLFETVPCRGFGGPAHHCCCWAGGRRASRWLGKGPRQLRTEIR